MSERNRKGRQRIHYARAATCVTTRKPVDPHTITTDQGAWLEVIRRGRAWRSLASHDVVWRGVAWPDGMMCIRVSSRTPAVVTWCDFPQLGMVLHRRTKGLWCD